MYSNHLATSDQLHVLSAPHTHRLFPVSGARPPAPPPRLAHAPVPGGRRGPTAAAARSLPGGTLELAKCAVMYNGCSVRQACALRRSPRQGFASLPLCLRRTETNITRSFYRHGSSTSKEAAHFGAFWECSTPAASRRLRRPTPSKVRRAKLFRRAPASEYSCRMQVCMGARFACIKARYDCMSCHTRVYSSTACVPLTSHLILDSCLMDWRADLATRSTI